MNYIEVDFNCEPCDETATDILSAMLAEVGFESFIKTDTGMLAYVPEVSFEKEAIQHIIQDLPIFTNVSFNVQLLESKNWNEEWEKNYFTPLIIDNRCIIQSTFHNAPMIYEYNIFIEPKMAFGTGHHQTTELMIREMLDFDFNDKLVLDMGCGTAILAILASMKQAKSILAIDIDQWAYDNARENMELNKVDNITIKIGDAELLNDLGPFDVILANINKNILLNDIRNYSAVLCQNGVLFVSGFYENDIEAITQECRKYNLNFESSKSKDEWSVVKFRKL